MTFTQIFQFEIPAKFAATILVHQLLYIVLEGLTILSIATFCKTFK